MVIRIGRAGVLVTVGLVAACSRSLEVPQPPGPPGPGTVQGTVVFTQPGSTQVLPANRATVELQGTSIRTTADGDGYFSLTPIPSSSGSLIFRFDANGDGVDDHLKVLRLEGLNAGPGKTVALGNVVLAGNAQVRGSVLRADLLGSSSGHAGTTLFVPEGPFLTYSGDNGSFLLDALPEGEVTIAVFRAGYQSQQTTVTLKAQETFSLPTVILTRDTEVPPPSTVAGVVTLFGSPNSGGVTVSASSTDATFATTTATDGTYSFTAVPQGIYSFGFVRDGYQTVTLRNVLVTSAAVDLRQVVMVPGQTMAADLDAGPGFDAGPPVDAGTDAGSDAGTDAGTDAGASVVAVIAPLPPYVGTNASFMLNAQQSTGVRPLVFHWAAPAGITIANNNSALAATPQVVAPSSATVLTFSLAVTDASGRTSPTVMASVPVGTAPNATIAGGFPTTVYAGQQVLFDGTPSVDPGGSGITAYDWVVTPAGQMTVSQAGGAKLLFTAPSSVPTPLVVNVSLAVTNGLGIVSSRAMITFSLTTATAPSWTVDAGPGQTVSGGALVTLKGGYSSPGFPGATFSTVWSPSREPSTGVADWQLTDPTALTTTFVAPVIVGANRLITLSLAATSTSGGVMPAMQAAPTFVNVLDKTPPTVTGTSVTGALRGGNLGVWVDFSEPIDPASLAGVSVSPGSVSSRQLINGTRVYVMLGGTPMADGTSATLSVSGVTDLSPARNVVAPQSLNFVAQLQWSPPFESTQSSATVEPRPGLVLRKSTNTSGVEALVFGRNGSAPWFLAPIDPSSCTPPGPCSVADDATAPTGSLTPTLPRGPRGALFNGNAIATVQNRDYTGATGISYFKGLVGGWTTFPSPPGQVFSDGVSNLFALYAQSGLRIAPFDANTQTWNQAASTQISSDAVLFSSGVTADPVPIGLAKPGNDTFVLARTSTSGEVQLYSSPGGSSTWSSFGSLGTAGNVDKIVEPRVALSPNYTTAAYVGYLRQSGRLDIVVCCSVNNGATVYPSGVTSFDLMYRENALWIAAVVGGQLKLSFLPYGTFSVFPFTGPQQPSNSLNNNPGCQAESPELQQYLDKVGISWAERCAGGPWKLYFRILN